MSSIAPSSSESLYTGLFAWHAHWELYLLFSLLVLGLVALDMRLFDRPGRSFNLRSSLAWSIVWIALGLAVGGAIYLYALYEAGAHTAGRLLTEYFTGYLVEKTLAIDNIFVFVVIFKTLQIQKQAQRRVLFYGILGALLFRAIFITLGAHWLQHAWVLTIFGVLLILSGIKLLATSLSQLRSGSGDHSQTQQWVQRLCEYLPRVDQTQSSHFFIKKGTGWFITPSFVALIAIECSDLLFAVDSVPAIFALTNEPFIVFTSNMCAILGLRSLYFLLADMIERLRLLSIGLSAVLIFIGLKIVWLNPLYDGHFPIGLSLAIILGCLMLSGLASLLPIPLLKQDQPRK